MLVITFNGFVIFTCMFLPGKCNLNYKNQFDSIWFGVFGI